ncbi:MAG TPA: winged helix-turn-helix domain-containing protein [Candidatus Sulfotelmatobacter sp.]|nr:winged helix-turn-helix domain-containing protein [Candidatus Sulfotelmatobacter sp.]
MYRFGGFVLDPASAELRNNGNTTRLQPQPLQILLTLLEHPGKIVTREQFRKSLWAEDTYVEFDDGLNHAIRRLRQALRDTAQVPQFIETIPRRGYRFISPVSIDSPSLPAANSAEMPARRSLLGRGILFAAVAIAALVILGVTAVRERPASRIDSLAVLPLANFSGDSEQEFFADGLTEELTTELAQINRVRVISRTSAMRFKGAKLPLAQIGRELGVDAVVEGSVQNSAGRVRISAQLVQIAGERHLWAESYERNSRDPLEVRRDVALQIAGRIREKIAPAESPAPRQQKLQPRAYDAYLLGTRLSDRGDDASYLKSIQYFEEAIRLDPGFALAYAELAESHGMLAFHAEERGEHFEAAKAASAKALELDPTLAEAQIGDADLRFYWDWDWTQCDGAFRLAAEKYPNSAQVQYHYGLCLFVLGRHAEALRYLDRARLVDPLSPQINRSIGWLLGMMGRPQEAMDRLRQAIDIDPDNAGGYRLLSWAYDKAGMESQAVAAYIQGRKLAGDSESEIGSLQKAYDRGKRPAFDKQRSEILKAKQSLKKNGTKDSSGYLALAAMYADIGDANSAFEYLEKAYLERNPRLVWIKSSLDWEPLRNDPRYHALIRKMNLTE